MTLNKRRKTVLGLLLAILGLFQSHVYGSFTPARKDNVIFKALFDENGGSMAHDYSSYGASITLQGSVAWVKDNGDFGQGVSNATNTWSPTIDGAVYIPEVSSNYLETAPSTLFDFQNNAFTVLLVVSKEKRGTNCSFLNFTNSASNEGFTIGATAGNQLHFTRLGLAQHSWTTFPAFDRPLMLVCSRDPNVGGGTVKLYINGNLDNTITGVGGITAVTGAQRLVICGTNVATTVAFIGKIAKVVIWNAALTDAEAHFMWVHQFERRSAR